MPVIGGGYDGTYYGQKGNESIFSANGNAAPINGLTYDYVAKADEAEGRHQGRGGGLRRIGVVERERQDGPAVRGPNAGHEGRLHEHHGRLRVLRRRTRSCSGIKNAGADATYLPMVASTNIAIVQGLQQNGVDIKANVLATGYGQDLLDSPAAATLGANTVLWQGYVPVENKTPATKQFVTDIKKTGIDGIPDYGDYLGYITADMAVTGLQEAGKNPTREGFVANLHKLGTYDGAGLTCTKLDISLENYGKYAPTGCAYFETVKDGKFLIYNKGKPVTGKLIGDADLLKKNAAGELSDVTTTTAAAPAS